MSSEYTRGFVIKFLPAQFSWIYVAFEEFLNRNVIHWNIFHFIVYLKVAVKNSLIIWMQFDTGYEFACVQTSPIRRRLHAGKLRVTEATNGVIFQIINSCWFDGNSWPPGISIFFALDGKFPGVGTKKRANAPSSVNTATFFIDHLMFFIDHLMCDVLVY